MEFYQSCQNRANQTIAVVLKHVPGLKVGDVDTAAYTNLCNELDALSLERDMRVSDEDSARNAENLAYQTLRTLTLALPRVADGELDDRVAEERKLLGHLKEVYSVTPRTTELALARGRKLHAALGKMNAWLAGLVPARPQISAGGKDITHLAAAMNAMPGLEQALENAAAEARDARTDLRNAATALDRLNKRFYKKLKAEALTNPVLAEALAQIETDSVNLPETLSIQNVLQAGEGFLFLNVAYVPGKGRDADERHLDWMVEGEDADFAHTAAAEANGNLIGPFAAGQTIIIRTRTVNGNGTRRSAKRRLTLVAV
jgi:hypothetical protein